MPLSEPVFQLLKKISRDYLNNKLQSKDILEKQTQMRSVKQLIKENKNSTDEKLIGLILELSKQAVTTQLKGSVHSSFADHLIRMAHIILSQIQSEKLNQAILDKMAFFDKKMLEYYEAFEASKEQKPITDIEKTLIECMMELMHLGSTHLLLDLSYDEIQEIFPSAPDLKLENLGIPIPEFLKKTAEGAFSFIGKKSGFITNEKRFLYRGDVDVEAIPHLPIIALPYAFEQFFIKTYDPTQQRFFTPPGKPNFPTPMPPVIPEMKPNYTQPVSRQVYETLFNDIDMYISISGNSERIKQSEEMKERLEELMTRTENAFKTKENNAMHALKKENAFANEWFDLLSDMGKLAYDMQVMGSYQIAGVPITSCAKGSEIFHKAVHELRKELQTNVPHHLDARLLKEKYLLEVKKINARNKKGEGIEPDSAKEIEADVLLQRRNLANFGDLRPLIALKQTLIKKMFIGEYGDEYHGSAREKMTGAKVGGYKWNHTAGVGKGYKYLPEALWPNFPERFKDRWAGTIKQFDAQKIATKDAAAKINVLEKELAIFINQEITEADIALMKSNIDNIVSLIKSGLEKEKEKLTKNLREQIDIFNKIESDLAKKYEAKRQAEQAAKVAAEELQKKSEKEAITNIADLEQVTLRLLTTYKLLKEKSQEELKSDDRTSGFFTEVSVLNDAYIIPIQRAIEESHPDRRGALTKDLSRVHEKVAELLKASKDIENGLKQTDEPLLLSPVKDEVPKSPASTGLVINALNISPAAIAEKINSAPKPDKQPAKRKHKNINTKKNVASLEPVDSSSDLTSSPDRSPCSP